MPSDSRLLVISSKVSSSGTEFCSSSRLLMRVWIADSPYWSIMGAFLLIHLVSSSVNYSIRSWSQSQKMRFSSKRAISWSIFSASKYSKGVSICFETSFYGDGSSVLIYEINFSSSAFYLSPEWILCFKSLTVFFASFFKIFASFFIFSTPWSIEFLTIS